MRQVPATMSAAWEAEDKTGPRRPTVRATIQRSQLQRYYYDYNKAAGRDFEHQANRIAPFTTLQFGDNSRVIELPNIQSCRWTRSVNQDVAECTLTLLNTELTPLGVDSQDSNLAFERPGAFTFSRGEPGHEPSPWGYPQNDRAWNGLIVPDRIVKTYEGYGVDYSVAPGRDPNLVQTGAWLIDEVEYHESGEITLQMRDLGRLLLDQIVFPPAVPHEHYPLTWSRIRTETVPGRDVTGGKWVKLTRQLGKASSSNSHYVGKGFTNEPFRHYVASNGAVNGHHHNHVLDDDFQSFWMSTGQDSYTDDVWWQFDFNDPVAIAGVRMRLRGGPFRVRISLKTDKGWVGRKDIPYAHDPSDPESPRSVNIGANIPFVRSFIGDRFVTFEKGLERRYGNVRAIRITLSRLTLRRTGEHPFFAGLRSVAIYTADDVRDLGFTMGEKQVAIGNYRDYTDLVKWICSWGGFWWPTPDTGAHWIKLAEGDKADLTMLSPDQVLPKGAVWGDFMRTGTGGITDLTPDLFDKQPLMDVINYVRDVAGYNFYIDEMGAPIWRMPNLWKLGNYLTPQSITSREASTRTNRVITLDASQHLLDYSTTLSSRNSRERVFVAGTTGRKGVVIRGYRGPYGVGLRRVAGWTDQHFETNRECVVMADMIAARQMFDWRRGTVRIAANPEIQIDDQIRIFAPVTNETFYHYVEQVSSELDMSTGSWTYDLTTHWLGENPQDAWVVDVQKLKRPTNIYLREMGVID